jgi:hypothetical protein
VRRLDALHGWHLMGASSTCELLQGRAVRVGCTTPAAAGSQNMCRCRRSWHTTAAAATAISRPHHSVRLQLDAVLYAFISSMQISDNQPFSIGCRFHACLPGLHKRAAIWLRLLWR